MEASTTKVPSKGQIVIPVNVRKAAGLKEGEKILAIAFGNTLIKMVSMMLLFGEAMTL